MAESMKKQEKKKDKEKEKEKEKEKHHHGHTTAAGAEPSSSGKHSWYDPSAQVETESAPPDAEGKGEPHRSHPMA